MAFQKITDRAEGVKQKLGNRSDLAARIYLWLRDAYIELAMAYPFDELLSTVDVSTVGGTNETGTYTYPTGVRAIRSLALIDTSSKQSTTLERKNIRIIDNFNTATLSKPAIYCTWVLQTPAFVRQVFLRPLPDKVYTLRWRVWMKPTINATVENTELAVSDDWLEIVDYCAALRGFTELLEHDRATAIRDLLYGFIDPRSGKRQPGLIASRMTGMQAEYEAGELPFGDLSTKVAHGKA